MNRRGFFVGAAAALLAAPAIVRVAANLMPVSTQPETLRALLIEDWNAIALEIWVKRTLRDAAVANKWMKSMVGIPDILRGNDLVMTVSGPLPPLHNL